MTDFNAIHIANNDLNNATAEASRIGMEALNNNGPKIDVESMMAAASVTSLLKAKKTGNMMHDNKNLIGGLIGGAIAVGLEIASPTGSTASAVAAGLAVGGTLFVTHKVLDVAPQTNGLAAANGALTCFVGMTAGRIVADYFPGNLVDSE